MGERRGCDVVDGRVPVFTACSHHIYSAQSRACTKLSWGAAGDRTADSAGNHRRLCSRDGHLRLRAMSLSPLPVSAHPFEVPAP